MSNYEKYTLVLIEDQKIGGYTAFYQEIPYAVAEGETKEEATKNLNDLIDYIETVEDLKGL